MPAYMNVWMILFRKELDRCLLATTDGASAAATCCGRRMDRMLAVAHHSARGNEANKRRWMQQQTVQQRRGEEDPPLRLAALLVRGLRVLLTAAAASAAGSDRRRGAVAAGNRSAAAANVCRFIAVLCTFDDFRTAGTTTATTDEDDDDDAAAVVASSANQHAHTFAGAGAVQALHGALLAAVGGTESEGERQRQEGTRPGGRRKAAATTATAAGAAGALRALAVHDDIVQRMAREGVLSTARSVFHDAVRRSSSPGDDSVLLLTALLGLFRNVAANDDIKSRLCVGNAGQPSIVPDMIRAMRAFPREGLLQEHCAGLIAAMALRKPDNSEFLAKAGVAEVLVRAMRNHPRRAPLQRQCALALRNLVGRSPHLRPTILLGAEDPEDSPTVRVLRDVAAQHLGCQDEVFAALRDLGVNVRSVQIEKDVVTGRVSIQQRQMFGERNPNFRPVHD
jgi:hypothetical protein